MTRSALAKVATRKALRDTWDDFWKQSRNQSAPGVDGVTLAAFNKNREWNIDRVHQEMEAGYKFSPLRPFTVEKSNGKKRIICVPTVKDRLVQRLISNHLTSQADRLGILNEVSFGFVKSTVSNPRGVGAARDRALQLRQEYPWAYKTDISSFFDRIPRDQLLDKTIRYLRAPSFKPLIRGIIDCEIQYQDAALAHLIEESGIQRGRGVRQGMPLSPLLSNIVLRDFDQEMIKAGRRMVRYADDLIVLAASRNECEEIDFQARSLLAKMQLELPVLGTQGKTQIAEPDEPIDFLGLALQRDVAGRYRLVITPKQLDRIRQELGRFHDVKRLARDGINIIDLGKMVTNSVGGYRSAYSCAQNAVQLDRVLDGCQKVIVRRILTNAFSEKAVQGLSLEYQIFFGMAGD